MPRNVRNFWIELDVDGKKTRIATGPASKDGGFDLTVKMRNEGGIVKALQVNGYACDNGVLVLSAHGKDCSQSDHPGAAFRCETQR